VNIELKNIKHSEFASQETHCYEATLYVDGVRWGTVYNEGHGGPDGFHGVDGKTWHDIAALNARIAKEFPRITFDDDPEGIAADLDIVCCDLVNKFLRSRDLKRISARMKTNVLYFKEPPVDGSTLYQIPLKGYDLAAVVAALSAKYPDAVIVNTLPQDEALTMLELAA